MSNYSLQKFRLGSQWGRPLTAGGWRGLPTFPLESPMIVTTIQMTRNISGYHVELAAVLVCSCAGTMVNINLYFTFVHAFPTRR